VRGLRDHLSAKKKNEPLLIAGRESGEMNATAVTAGLDLFGPHNFPEHLKGGFLLGEIHKDGNPLALLQRAVGLHFDAGATVIPHAQNVEGLVPGLEGAFHPRVPPDPVGTALISDFIDGHYVFLNILIGLLISMLYYTGIWRFF